jgi:hypothetical protein
MFPWSPSWVCNTSPITQKASGRMIKFFTNIYYGVIIVIKKDIKNNKYSSNNNNNIIKKKRYKKTRQQLKAIIM